MMLAWAEWLARFPFFHIYIYIKCICIFFFFAFLSFFLQGTLTTRRRYVVASGGAAAAAAISPVSIDRCTFYHGFESSIKHIGGRERQRERERWKP